MLLLCCVLPPTFAAHAIFPRPPRCIILVVVTSLTVRETGGSENVLLLVFHQSPIQAVGKVSENKTEIGSVLISDMSSLNLLTISLSEMLEVRLTDLTFDRPLERERWRKKD